MKNAPISVSILTLSVVFCFTIGCSGAGAFFDGLAGNWKGKSNCTIKNSPCNDEHVIYRVETPDADGKLKIQMDKVVDGKPELMGTVLCTHDQKASVITCLVQENIWKFTVTGEKMVGTLTRGDGRMYRRISVVKEKPPKASSK